MSAALVASDGCLFALLSLNTLCALALVLAPIRLCAFDISSSSGHHQQQQQQQQHYQQQQQQQQSQSLQMGAAAMGLAPPTQQEQMQLAQVGTRATHTHTNTRSWLLLNREDSSDE